MSKRILYIENNPHHLQLVRKILVNQRYEVLEAMNGVTGLDLASTEKPDLIIMDTNLPDIDGLEAISRIKAEAGMESIPILALTANATYGDEERARKAGYSAYMIKPVSRAKLIEHIEQHLNIAE